MNEAEGKIHIETTKLGHQSKGRVYIPADLVKDSLFHFKDKEEVLIEIKENGNLTVKKIE